VAKANRNPNRQDIEALRRQRDQLLIYCLAIAERWNKHVEIFNANLPNPTGRPPAASPEQVETIRKLHDGGMSLRRIAAEMDVSLGTVRGVTERGERPFRWRELLERIDPERDLNLDLTALLRRQSGKRPLTKRSDR
jgi:Helix-turn-helix domain of resolvase